jgi:hypothetical protein
MPLTNAAWALQKPDAPSSAIEIVNAMHRAADRTELGIRERMRQLKFFIGSAALDDQCAAARVELEELRAQLKTHFAEKKKGKKT